MKNGPKLVTTSLSTTIWLRKHYRSLEYCKPQTNSGTKDDTLSHLLTGHYLRFPGSTLVARDFHRQETLGIDMEACPVCLPKTQRVPQMMDKVSC